MANFTTHITVSTLAGVGYGAVAYAWYDVPGPTCLLAGGLCGVSGMLPDIDSGPGRPLRESLAFAAAVVSTMLVDRFQQFGWSMEAIILAGAMFYLAIRFGMSALLKRFTVHRGMFHSIPAAIIFGEVAYLLASGDLNLRLYKAGGVVAGYLVHLILDEMYSVHYVRGRMQFKRSFGTAIKLFDRRLWPNVATYLKLALFTFLAVKDQVWMEQFYRERLEARTQQWTQRLVDYSAQKLGARPTGPTEPSEVAGAQADSERPAALDPARPSAPALDRGAVPRSAQEGGSVTRPEKPRWSPRSLWRSDAPRTTQSSDAVVR